MASFYPFSVGLLASAALWFLAGRDEFTLPSTELSFKVAVIFLIWVVISLLVNSYGISTAVFKGRSGGIKAVLQFLLLIYCFIISIYAFQCATGRSENNSAIDRFILLSLIIPALFSILEVLYLYKVSSGAWLSYLRPFISENHNLYERLRSVSGEPTSFAFYCAFLAPWFMRRLILCDPRRLIVYSLIFAYFIFLVVLTLSKAAYIMVIVGLVIFLVLAYLRTKNCRRVLFATVGFFGCFWFLNIIAPKVTVYMGAVVENPISSILFGAANLNNPAGGMSTRVRLTAQIATFRVANANPIFGVGFAQAGFHMYKYVPVWEMPWPEEVKNWGYNISGSAWAPSHGLHARIAAETGYMGLLLWLGIWGALGIAILRKTLKTTGEEALLGAALCAGVSSCVLMGFNVDTFKFFEYWLVLGLGWAYLRPSTNWNL